MASPAPSTRADTPLPPMPEQGARHSTSNLKALKELESIAARLRTARFPQEPYIMYIDEPVGRAADAFKNLHARCAPFARGEEHLQYQTLLYREFSNEILRLRAPHEELYWLEQSRPSSSQNAALTPKAAPVAKKKISLQDYKSRSRANTQTSTPNPKLDAPSVDLRKDAIKNESKARVDSPPSGRIVPASTSTAADGGKHDGAVADETASDNGLKRSHDQFDLDGPSRQLQPASDGSSKKPRVSLNKTDVQRPNSINQAAVTPDPILRTPKHADPASSSPDASGQSEEPTINRPKADSVDSNGERKKSLVIGDFLGILGDRPPHDEKVTPPWLSPLRPSKAVPSPSSPETIGPVESSAATSTSSLQSLGFETSAAGADIAVGSSSVGKAQSRSPGATTNAAFRSTRNEKVASSTDVRARREGDADSKPLPSTPRVKATASKSETQADRKSDYINSKQQVRRVEQKVQSLPNAFSRHLADQATRAAAAQGRMSPTGVTRTDKLSCIAKLKYGKSRAAAVSQLLKLRKPLDRENETRAGSQYMTSNPKPTASDNPLPSAPNASDQAAQTPKALPTTPYKSHGSPETPSSLPRTISSATTASDSGADALQAKAWDDERARQIATGRRLKNEMKELGVSENHNKRKLGAVKGIESLLCFIQAFVAQDRCTRNKKSRIESWQSLVAFIHNVLDECRPFRHLEGFAMLIRSGVLSVIVDLLIQLDKPSDEESKSLRSLFGKARLAAIRSSELLSQETIAEQYPATAKESRKLPVGIMTDPLVLAGMGVRFLEEFTQRERMDWTKQLVDDKFTIR